MNYVKWIAIAFASLMGAVSFNSYVNRNRPHVPDQQEVFTSKCISEGGNPSTKSGWQGDIYIREFKCEDSQDE